MAGLRGELKTKLVGHEGTFEQLLEVARFKEARIRDVVQHDRANAPWNSGTTSQPSARSTSPDTTTASTLYVQISQASANLLYTTVELLDTLLTSAPSMAVEHPRKHQDTAPTKRKGPGRRIKQECLCSKLDLELRRPLSWRRNSQVMYSVRPWQKPGISPATVEKDSTLGPTPTSQTVPGRITHSSIGGHWVPSKHCVAELLPKGSSSEERAWPEPGEKQ